jgi:hypothetical protein
MTLQANFELDVANARKSEIHKVKAPQEAA